MMNQSEFEKKAEEHIKRIYGEPLPEVVAELSEVVDDYSKRVDQDTREELWDETDIALICYGDQISPTRSKTALAALHKFLVDNGLDSLLSHVHLLPFCPYTSDDGFSVVHYKEVRESVGTWSDVERLGKEFRLMFDLVLNHASKECEWFKGYLEGDERFKDFFHDIDPSIDLSKVMRPRTSPLLTEFDSKDGKKHIWTTFSDDQIDLNFENPKVLIKMVDVFLYYLEKGASIVRLDAIALLWKEIGTSCIHLPETHEIVKLLRSVTERVAPKALILTETNVPHEENISYFGEGDEAHMVYQFSLPPLLLEAFNSENGSYLLSWAKGLEVKSGTTWFNFTSSHDGIGVRPLQGLLPSERVDALCASVKERGGMVSYRTEEGGETPYELNTTWFSAISSSDNHEENVQRFLASHALMLGLQGVPAIYFHNLVATTNDHEGMKKSGRARTLNRRVYTEDEITEIPSKGGHQAEVLRRFKELMKIRKTIKAFHPDASQKVLDLKKSGIIAFERENSGERVIVITNVTSRSVDISLEELGADTLPTNLIPFALATIDDKGVRCPQNQTLWLQV